MKYSIIISPLSQNSNATTHALKFIQAILKNHQATVSVFFYGHATVKAFEFDQNWENISQHKVALFACSTIAEKFTAKDQSKVEYIDLAGLGQWMEFTHNANKHIEFT